MSGYQHGGYNDGYGHGGGGDGYYHDDQQGYYDQGHHGGEGYHDEACVAVVGFPHRTRLTARAVLTMVNTTTMGMVVQRALTMTLALVMATITTTTSTMIRVVKQLDSSNTMAKVKGTSNPLSRR